MKTLNKLDNTKGIAAVGLAEALLIGVAIFSSGELWRKCLFLLAAIGAVFFLFLVFRGTGRRIHNTRLQNREMQKSISDLGDSLKTVETLAKEISANTAAFKGTVRTINNIAGSVSKARAVQAGMQNAIAGLSNAEPSAMQATKSNTAEESKPATNRMPKAPALAKSPTSVEETAQRFGKQWQLKKDLILPYSAELDNRDFFKPRFSLLSGLKAVVILDPFSWGSISPEIDARPVTPGNWFEVFEEHQPDIFLCESAWQGMPGDESPWKARIYGSVNFKYENRSELLAILEYCSQKGIPTIFWNKEDPTHFTDRVNDFVDTAKRFDYIWTTAGEMVPEYFKLTGKRNAECMPFGVQPRLFNALDREHSDGENQVVFAGSWYKNHSERQEIQGEILNSVLDSGLNLKIYDRYSGRSTEQFGYPAKYADRIQPAVPYEKTADLYRTNQYGISINTVTSSPTMLARRAFEMAATGCTIITNRTRATEHFFGDEIVQLDRPARVVPELLHDRAERRLKVLNRVLKADTYEARLQKALKQIGISVETDTAGVCVMIRLRLLEDVEPSVRHARKLGPIARQIVILVDASVEPHTIQEFYKAASLKGAVAISEKYWQENGLDPKSVFELPFVFVATEESIRLAKSETIQRALMHATYSSNPVFAEDLPVWPKTSIKHHGVNCVMKTCDVVYEIEHGFETGVVTVV